MDSYSEEIVKELLPTLRLSDSMNTNHSLLDWDWSFVNNPYFQIDL